MSYFKLTELSAGGLPVNETVQIDHASDVMIEAVENGMTQDNARYMVGMAKDNPGDLFDLYSVDDDGRFKWSARLVYVESERVV